MKSSEIRSAFLTFFKERGHEKVTSGSLVPANDPTLLFTNAGMNQFKDVFLGRDKRAYSRATTAQKCVRAGGKHNDLENVGYTARHHTFFEMLGNFSFGDYFKREAIGFAWEFLTRKLGLSEEKLWVTVYEEDKDAENIWLKEIGISADRFSRLGKKDNFWSMGDTGPCGPCSEIFYDHGADIAGDPPGGINDDGDRYIEIWNMVFMQFNRTADSEMHPLPHPSIDTGMGLERIAAVMQGVHNNYEIDLFQSLLSDASGLLDGAATTNSSLRVIADHIRSCSFLVADGVMPSNDGRGYALRRIIRRACRHGHKLGAKGTFFYKLVASLVKEMGNAYPELVEKQAFIERILLQEEEQFSRTLDKGMAVLEDRLKQINGNVIPGDVVFTLYDTYGFPVDLTEDIARERCFVVDRDGFEKALESQRNRARAASHFEVDYNDQLMINGETEFTGYHSLKGAAHVVGLFVNGEPVDAIKEGMNAIVVLDQTPFYGESGGQAGDRGIIECDGGKLIVHNTLKQGRNHLQQVSVLSGLVSVKDAVCASVDEDRREATALNHSSTHLLHAALREVLGKHVAQKGSLVNSDHLRFDFSHFEAMKPEELREVERRVNEQIRKNTPVTTEVMDIDQAREKGAMALFGEKYGDRVRVLTMGQDGFSVELCGGTHVERTGDIGTFHIVSESGIASGVRRIEAVTGKQADDWVKQQLKQLHQISELVKAPADDLYQKVSQLVADSKAIEREKQQLQQKLAASRAGDILSEMKEIHGVKLLASSLEGQNPKALRDIVDQIKNKLGSGVVVLAATNGSRISLATGVTGDLTARVHAGELLKMVALQVGGKGGGRADFAQGGGSQPEHLPSALESVAGWLESKI
ncbi:Alanine--tRNA ligase [invertebrate metagenome]|uniref:Alanine--tRNA ligase n=1 Tax=invertebrate metagenome TaxID=1711999 RepID=A0A2H9T5D5_9ZZZZ